MHLSWLWHCWLQQKNSGRHTQHFNHTFSTLEARVGEGEESTSCWLWSLWKEGSTKCTCCSAFLGDLPVPFQVQDWALGHPRHLRTCMGPLLYLLFFLSKFFWVSHPDYTCLCLGPHCILSLPIYLCQVQSPGLTTRNYFTDAKSWYCHLALQPGGLRFLGIHSKSLSVGTWLLSSW